MLISENELNSQNLEEFTLLLHEFIRIKPNKFIEIGSLYGWTLQHFIHYSQSGSVALSIDLPVRNFVGSDDKRVEKQEYNYKNIWPLWAKANNCKLHLIPDISQKPETLASAKKIFNNKQIDFLFIDGNHSYQGVKTDFEMYGPLVRKGGIIAFHDIGENEEGGVFNLWQEIKSINSSCKEFLCDVNKEKGIGVLFV